MQLQIEIRPTTTAVDVVYGLYLVLHMPDAEPTTIECLQDGYASPEQAALALVECLTYAAPPPPDLSSLELAAEAVSGLSVGAEEMGDAIRILGERMNTVEDRLDAQGKPQPQVPARRSLLPGRESAQQHQEALAAQPPAPARPQIRRTLDQNEEGQNLAGRVHGQFFGGVSRRGRQ